MAEDVITTRSAVTGDALEDITRLGATVANGRQVIIPCDQRAEVIEILRYNGLIRHVA